jgi:SMODS domain-containing protein
MAECESYLWDLVRSVEPTQTQKDGASRSQNYLRDLLSGGNMGARIISSYLSGSYARDTAVAPMDDVDIIFVIDPSFWGSLSGWPSPSTVLDSFANAIRYRYPISSVFGQRRSVRLQLNHLDIDVVPAIESATEQNVIWIPDKQATSWIKSSPKVHSANATRVNRVQNGKFKPLVKLLKYWNNGLPSTAHFKSFAIETIAVRIFDSFTFGTLQEGLHFFFDYIAFASGNSASFTWKDFYGMSFRWLNCVIPDAAGTGTNIVDGIEENRRSRFVEHAVRSRNKIVEANSALSVDTACRRVSEALKL